jgi:hypothetical protein
MMLEIWKVIMRQQIKTRPYNFALFFRILASTPVQIKMPVMLVTKEVMLTLLAIFTYVAIYSYIK